MHGSDETGFNSVDECSLRPVLLLGACPALSTPRLFKFLPASGPALLCTRPFLAAHGLNSCCFLTLPSPVSALPSTPFFLTD